MPSPPPTNQTRIPQSTYPPLSLPLFEYLHQKQNLRKPQSHLPRRHRSTCQVERSVRHSISNANLNSAPMPQNNEEWTGPIKDSRHLHHPKDTLRRKGPQLHLRNSGKVLRSLNSP